MSDYGSQEVQCPYYKKEGEKIIKCEGIFSQFDTHTFRGDKQKEKYASRFCRKDYKACHHYKKVTEKYFT